MSHRLRVAILTCAVLSLAGCASDNPKVAAAPTSTMSAWNIGMVVSGDNTAGTAAFTYADGTTRTFRFGGIANTVTDTGLVLVGQTVSIKVTVEDGGNDSSQASCQLNEADYDLEGKIPLVTKTGRKGETFTCEWTNDGTLTTPKPEK